MILRQIFKITLLCGAFDTSLHATPFNSSPEKYLGSHAYSNEFCFQEMIRSYDVALYHNLKKQLGNKKADMLFYNGWCEIIAAAYLLEHKPSDLKISDDFEFLVRDEIQKAILKGLETPNPFAYCGVRENAKKFLMYPHLSYRGFEKTELEFHTLNQILKDSHYYFEYDGEYFSFQIDSSIFDKLWGSDFEKTLESKGYIGFARSIYKPHITLLGTDDIQKIRPYFHDHLGQELGEKALTEFFRSFVEKLNARLRIEKNPLEFNELSSTYCDSFPPYELVIVAKIRSDIIVESVLLCLDEVEKIFGQKPNIIPNDSLHFTVAVKFREAASDINDMPTTLQETGSFRENLEQFWKAFTNSFFEVL